MSRGVMSHYAISHAEGIAFTDVAGKVSKVALTAVKR